MSPARKASVAASPAAGTQSGVKNMPAGGEVSRNLIVTNAAFTAANIASVRREDHSASPVKGTANARTRTSAVVNAVATSGVRVTLFT